MITRKLGKEEERDHATNDLTHFTTSFRYMQIVFDLEYTLLQRVALLVIPVVAAGSIYTHLKTVSVQIKWFPHSELGGET